MQLLPRSATRARAALVLAVSLTATGPAAGAESERTGTIDGLNAEERTVVINDARYRVADGALVRHRGARGVDWWRMLRPGQHVRYRVTGEGGNQSGAVTSIDILTGSPSAPSE